MVALGVMTVSYERGRPVDGGAACRSCVVALPADTQLESGTSQRKRGTSVDLGNNGECVLARTFNVFPDEVY